MSKAILKELISGVKLDKKDNYKLKQHLMNKTGITRKEASIILEVLSEKMDVGQESASIIIDTLIDGILKILVTDGKIVIPTIGSFIIKESRARTARNPRTGEKVELPNRNVIRFKPANKVKGLIK